MKHKRTDKWNCSNLLTGFLSSLLASSYFSAIVDAHVVTEEPREFTPFFLQTADTPTLLPKPLTIRKKLMISVTENETNRLMRKTVNQATKRTISGKVLFDTMRGSFSIETRKLVPEKVTAIN